MASLRAAAVAVVLPTLIAAGAARSGRVSASEQGRNPSPTIVLVELFTAEGCSSCPPADKLLEAMIATQPAPGVEIVGLGEHVDYWNALGWRDRFSSAALTARQRAYGDALGTANIYTPQMIVDGVAAFVGSDVAAARQAIEEAARSPHGRLRLELAAAGAREIEVTATIDSLPATPDGGADIAVAVVEDGLRSDVKRGENAGKVLTHAAVVRSMTTIGQAHAAESSAKTRIKVADDWKRDRLKVVAFVQERRSRRVLATATAAAPISSSSAPDAR
jgi:hypothetical protein